MVKKECDKCHKICNHVTKHMKLNEHWCRRCKRKYGTNIFYVPKEERLSRSEKDIKIQDEDRVLFREYLRRGLSSQAAWKKINATRKYLRKAKQSRRMKIQNQKIQQSKDVEKAKELNRKFVEGLR